jgi:UDP-N-acetylmuramoyl-L-alanyl-D-glutamate--2,6-diaminopimelate ligase
LRVIGVTGTNGKTVVSFLIRHFLESAGCRTGLIGSVRYEVGDRSIPAQRTTPEAVDVQNLMAQMERKGCDACVLEVSSHALKQRRVEAVEFKVGVFTNLSGEHLDYHGSLESYYGAKRRLFELVEGGGKRGAMVVNTDDAAGRRLMGDLGSGIRWTYGLGAGAEVLAREPRYGASGTRVRIETPRGAWEARSPLLGRFNVYNLLAAVGAAMALEVPVSVLRDAIPGLPQVPGRLERVDRGQPFNVLVDYAHTEAALRQVLLTVREVTAGRVRLVFGCGGMRDPAKRRPMGRAAGELADDVVVTSDNPRDESPHDIAMAIGSGLADAGRETWRVELDRGRAIEEAIREAQPGDSVVVAGKGHEGYQEFGDTVVPFDDRMHASQALEILGWRGSTGGSVVGSN